MGRCIVALASVVALAAECSGASQVTTSSRSLNGWLFVTPAAVDTSDCSGAADLTADNLLILLNSDGTQLGSLALGAGVVSVRGRACGVSFSFPLDDLAPYQLKIQDSKQGWTAGGPVYSEQALVDVDYDVGRVDFQSDFHLES